MNFIIFLQVAYVLGILQILIRIHAKWWPFWKKINQAYSLYNIINHFGQSFFIFYVFPHGQLGHPSC